MAAHLILKAEALAEHRSRAGLDTSKDLAAALRVSEATLSRVSTGKAEPGPRFIAGLFATFPDAAVRDLFDIHVDEVA